MSRSCDLSPSNSLPEQRLFETLVQGQARHHHVRAWVNATPSSLENFEEPARQISPQSHLKRMRRSPNSHRRVRPRPDPSSQSSAVNSFEMDSITDASSVTSLDSRRKLKATGPLMKRKGSQSPERTQRVLLEQGRPPIRIRQPDGTSQIVPSQELQGTPPRAFLLLQCAGS